MNSRSSSAEESITPSSTILLTLSIVQLDQSIRQIDNPTVEDFVTCVLDHHSIITPQDAVAGLQLQKDTITTTTLPSTITIRRSKEQNCTSALRNTVEKSILRYIRDTDRWTAVTSLLLKSLAWYRSLGSDFYNSIIRQESSISSTYKDEKINDDLPTFKLARTALISDTNQNKVLPIIDLPRTKYNRPYLPKFKSEKCNTRSSRSSNNDGDKDIIYENRNYIMNISHQYPWVCMVQQQQQQEQEQHRSKTSQHSSLGIDVVIFHAPTNQYTPTIFDFVSSFSNCFTSWEWDRIMNCQKCSTQRRRRSDVSMIREFFLRWSMKEAYTKAIGLGMQMDFHTFETRLCRIDDDDTSIHQDEEIWTSITRHAQLKNENKKEITRVHDNKKHQFSIIGRVSRYANPPSLSSPPSSSSSSSSSSSVWEEWEFIFVPLNNTLNNTTSCNETDNVHRDQGDNTLFSACACICIGPVFSKENTPSVVSVVEKKCTIESLTMLNLIEMHENNSK